MRLAFIQQNTATTETYKEEVRIIMLKNASPAIPASGIQACICPGTKMIFSFHCTEAHFGFRVKVFSLPILCYLVMSENLI